MTKHQPTAGADGEHVTFCRICEAQCGLVATVQDGSITRISPDRQNPHSQGHVCVKGIAATSIVYHPDRVLHPLKRSGQPGEFVRVSWDEALTDIAARLKSIKSNHGGAAIAGYLGNPTAFTTNGYLAHNEFISALGSNKCYGAGSQDSNSRLVANYLLYGTPMLLGIPDLPNCDFLLILGANPLVSNGSHIYAPRFRHDLDAIAQRGRVVVVDPRRTETARKYEHVPIIPNGDVWFLLSMLRVLIDDDDVDHEAIAADSIGWERLRQEILAIDLAMASEKAGVSVERITALARDFRRAPRAATYSRVGICRGPYATLANFLLTALAFVTGKVGIMGGNVFSRVPFAGGDKNILGGYGDARTRIGDVPDIAGFMATAMMPDDIQQEGEGRLRALIISAGNPVVSGPGGARLEKALQDLDLLVSLDLYQNETNKFADYILPCTTFLERADVPFLGLHTLIRPYLQYTDAVIPPQGEAREEYWIYTQIARHMGLGAPSPSPRKNILGRLNLLPSPLKVLDFRLRMGPVGDWFGLRRGWSFKRLRQHPHGCMTDLPPGHENWQQRLGYPDRKVRLWHDLVAAEFERLLTSATAPADLVLIGRRDIKSINSWMNNILELRRAHDPRLLVHPEDAAARGITSGDQVRLLNRNGDVTVEVEITEGVVPGSVCYPHGWGQNRAGGLGNSAQGANINVLLGLGLDGIERISGTTLIDGIDVSLEKVSYS